MDQDYYISGMVSEEDSERGPFAVICTYHIDGNIADVYGDDEETARAQAQKMIDALHAYDWLEERFRQVLNAGADLVMEVAAAMAVNRDMSLIDAIHAVVDGKETRL